MTIRKATRAVDMGKREYLDLSINKIPLLGIWMGPTTSGVSIGFRMPGRDVHLTTYFDQEKMLLNSHITDSMKSPKKQWEMWMSLANPEELMKEFMKQSFKRYYRFSTYYQLSDELHQLMGLQAGGIPKNFDIKPMLSGFLAEDSLVKRRIRRGFREDPKLGIIFRRNDTYLAMPLDERMMFVINMEPTRSAFWKFPPFQGLHRYLEYLEKEGLDEQLLTMDEEKKQMLSAEILGVLAEHGIEPDLDSQDIEE